MPGSTRTYRIPSERCGHQSRTTTTSVGLERETCDACGHVNFRWVTDIMETQIGQVEEIEILLNQR